MKREMTRLKIEEIVMQADPNLDLNSETFLAACVLLTSATIGPSADRVARFLEEPRKLVRTFGRRLRENGLWRDGMVHCGDWFDKKSGWAAFWLDVGVAIGYFNVVDPAA